MRSMRKIEDRPRPEKRRAIPRANRERSTDHQIPNSPLHELHECVALSGRVAKTQDKGMEDRSRQRIVVPPKEAAPQRIEEEVIDRLSSFPLFFLSLDTLRVSNNDRFRSPSVSRNVRRKEKFELERYDSGQTRFTKRFTKGEESFSSTPVNNRFPTITVKWLHLPPDNTVTGGDTDNSFLSLASDRALESNRIPSVPGLKIGGRSCCGQRRFT